MAGNKKVFDDIVNEEKVKEQVEFVLKQFDRIKQTIQTFPQLYGDFKNGNQAFSQMQAEIDKLKAKEKEMIDMSDQLNKANQKRIQLESDMAKQIAIVNLQNQEKNKKLKEEAKETLGLNDAYDKLNKQYQIAAKNAKALAAQHGINSSEAKKSVATALELNNKLKAIDASMGEHKRDVGDYKENIKSALGEISPAAEGVMSKIEGALSKFGPWGAAAAGAIAIAGGALTAFYEFTEEGEEKLRVRMAGFSGAMLVLTSEFSKLGKVIDNTIFGEEKAGKISHFWSELPGKIGAVFPILMAFAKIPYFKNLLKQMDDVSEASKKIAREEKANEKEQIGLIAKRSELNKDLINAREATMDENKTIAEKIELRNIEIEKSKELQELDVDAAKKEEETLKKKKELFESLGHWKDDDEKRYQEAIAKTAEVEAEYTIKRFKLEKQQAKDIKDLRQELVDLDIAILNNQIAKKEAANKRILANEKSTLIEKVNAERSSMEEALRLEKVQTLEKLSTPGMDETKKAQILKESETAQFKIRADFKDKTDKLKEDSVKKWQAATNEIEKTRLESAKDELLNAVKFDQELYESKMTLQKRLQILQKTSDIDIQEENLRYNTAKLALASDNAQGLEAVEEEHARKIRLIQTKAQLDQMALQKEFYKKHIQEIQEQGTRSENTQADKYNVSLQGLASQLSTGQISSKQFDRQKGKLDKDTAISSIGQQLSTTRQMQEAATKVDDFNAADQYEKHILELTKQRIDAQIDLEKKAAADRKAIEEKGVELLRKTGEFVITQQKNQIEKERNQLAERLTMIETTKAAEIVRIEDSTMAENDKALEIKRINAEELLQKQEIAAEEKKLKLKQAKADKEMALFNAIINTAIAVTSALSAGPGIGIALAVITAAMGALEIATIASKPIPAYADGTMFSKAGPALTDEKNPEGYITPSGNVFIGSNRPNIKKLEAGTKVFPNVDELNNYLLASMMINGSMNTSENQNYDSKKMDQLIMATHAQTTEITRAFKKNKPNITVNTKIDIGYQQYINNQVKN
jgi:hypothetical protein